MTPELIMMGLKLAQQKGQQNQADNQRLMQSMQAPKLDAQSLLGTGGQQQPMQNNLFETEEQKKQRLGLFY